MAKFEPTPAQRQAINAPIMDILVSAAAGSGKTAVLSQRILRLVTVPEGGAEIARMLIVTFTKAAAAELRSRIARSLRETLAELRALPEEERDADSYRREDRLLDAMDQLETAEVSTIHSFCYNLIRSHLSELSLPASLRIGDEAECTLLKMRVMDEVVETLYDEDEDFSLFAENLIELRDDGLSATLLDFYNKIESLPEGIGFVAKSGEMLREASCDFWNSPFAAPISRKLTAFFDYYRGMFAHMIALIREDDKGVEKYLPSFLEDQRFIEAWEQVKDSDYAVIKAFFEGYRPIDCKTYTKKPKEMAFVYGVRKEFVEAVRGLAKTYFSFTPEDVARDATDTVFYTNKLYTTLQKFETRYSEEKLRLGILDFADLEGYAYRLLVKDGAPTEIALHLREKYDAIFIDEYQDTNDLQDAIFAAISKHNRFMVGDIKQSIYGFRGAMPEIFSHYREIYPDYVEGAGQKQAKIFLSDNFRSDRGVLRYSNGVFEKLFTHNSGRVPYLPKDALNPASPIEKDLGLSTRFLVADEKAEDEEGRVITEARVVAREVYALLQKGVEAKEIVILLRQMTHAEEFREALSEYAVACHSSKTNDNLFDYPEILLLIALLNVIDNPTRDIYLAAVLKSPIFGFTLGELVTLRAHAKDGSLYASVKAFAALEKDAWEDPALVEIQNKAIEFLSFLEKARRFAELKSADKVVRYLYSVTPLRAIATKESGDCLALSAFYDFARSYEAGSFRGVHGLVRHIREVSAGKKDQCPRLMRAVDPSAVKIMSIHKSKGLEFDYVFLADADHAISNKDTTAPLIYEKTLGLGLKLKEPDGFVRYDTLIRQALAAQVEENTVDEEMRILYVALTRAKKQLTVTCGMKPTKDKTVADKLEDIMATAPFVHRHLYASAKSYAHWLLLTAPETQPLVVSSLSDSVQAGAQGNTAPSVQNGISQEILKERLSFAYPYAALVGLPTKLSVSRLYPGILDEEAEELIRSEKADFDRLPLFMQEKTEASAAERGTATHLFMQFCDYDNLLEKGIPAEIDRLVKEAFITAGIAELIDRDKLKVFFASDLFRRIREAEAVYREERFNVRLAAAEFSLDPTKAEAYRNEYILVQGVVDCLIREKDGSLTLIDYKTDHTPKDRAAAEAMLRERYTTQLSYYRRAVEQIFSTPVKTTLLYSFGIGDTVEIQ